MRIALTLFFVLLPSIALAQAFPCPSFTAGWAFTYVGQPITSVAYDQTTSLLYVVWGNTNATAFYPVPLSVIQTFSRSTNALATYNSYVANSYHALLLAQKNNCPILQETGAYIWTD